MRNGRAVRITTGISGLTGVFGLTVVAMADGRATWLVLASCLATFLVPLAVRLWAGRAPSADARFARILVSVAGYLVPMAVFQSLFAA